MKYILLRQCAHVFNRYCRHCVTNISQCNSINRNGKKLNKIHYKNQEFDLNLGRSYFFHPLSLILFLFRSYIFALNLDWVTVLVIICSSVVGITTHLVDNLSFDIYLLITVHFCFPNLDKKFFVLISALIVLILFLFPVNLIALLKLFL